MTIPRYIDRVDCETLEGEPGFLILTCTQHGERWSLMSRPAYTNRTHKPVLNGWCGETDNRNRYARGLARVAAFTPNDRARIERVPLDQTEAALERLGYPELL